MSRPVPSSQTPGAGYVLGMCPRFSSMPTWVMSPPSWRPWDVGPSLPPQYERPSASFRPALAARACLWSGEKTVSEGTGRVDRSACPLWYSTAQAHPVLARLYAHYHEWWNGITARVACATSARCARPSPV